MINLWLCCLILLTICAVMSNVKATKQWVVFGAGNEDDDMQRWNRYLQLLEPDFRHTVRGVSNSQAVQHAIHNRSFVEISTL